MLVAADGISSIGSGLIMPFLIIYLHRVRGLELDVSGLALSSIAFVGLAASPLAGVLIDRVGSRWTWMAGAALAALGATSLASITDAWHAFAALALFGAGIALSWPALFSVLNSVVEPSQRTSVYALHFALLNLGFGIGGIAGGLIVDVGSVRSFQWIFWLDALSFLAVIGVLAISRDAGPRMPKGADDETGGYREVLRDRMFVRIWLLAVLLVTVGYSQLTSAFPEFATGRGALDTGRLGLVFAANTFVIVVGQLFVLRKIEGVRRTRALMLLCALMGTSWLVTILAARVMGADVAFVLFALAAAVFALGETIHSTTLAPLVNDLAPDELRGRYNAAYSFAWSVGGIFGPAIAGFFLDQGRGEPLFLGLVGGMAVGVWLALGAERKLPERLNLIAPPAVAESALPEERAY